MPFLTAQRAQNDFRSTALSLALRTSDIFHTKTMLTRGAKHGNTVAGTDWEVRPDLHVAVLDDDTDAVLRYCGQASASIDGLCKGGYTALHLAALFGRDKIAKVTMHGARGVSIGDPTCAPPRRCSSAQGLIQ